MGAATCEKPKCGAIMLYIHPDIQTYKRAHNGEVQQVYYTQAGTEAEYKPCAWSKPSLRIRSATSARATLLHVTALWLPILFRTPFSFALFLLHKLVQQQTTVGYEIYHSPELQARSLHDKKNAKIKRYVFGSSLGDGSKRRPFAINIFSEELRALLESAVQRERCLV